MLRLQRNKHAAKPVIELTPRVQHVVRALPLVF